MRRAARDPTRRPNAMRRAAPVSLSWARGGARPLGPGRQPTRRPGTATRP
ncbi:hypothetical protein SAVERM_1210 [Streptomyces avermitilis MA-4680 = NBRC 14893]|uniref:Uncharacterized protein n=1 Tax=Streptomyces avermitilis (strain ATCC 31267 / DSM 46492 / JCM 5070 / NBRC 14893 / NCIMB 12804 / NRRL 8165 / MA-4680) TaxID=227882 RepID=Q82NT1_STRAW|nr:hypothetical protein SAVERM_1210 [Streptomyces avermitilis MA-4680 = NBRC 14893]